MILENWLMPRADASRIARSGQIHGGANDSAALALTFDSDFGAGPDEDSRIYRIPGRHWLPPDLYGEIFDAETWQLQIAYTGEDVSDLGTSWTETWQAGTSVNVAIDFGSRTDEVANSPGWESISDALAKRRYPMPPPADDDYWSLVPDLGMLQWTLTGEVGDIGEEVPASITVECRVPLVVPAFYAANPPVSTGPNMWAQEDLEPVWWVNGSFLAQARLDGVVVSQTQLGAFKGQEIGTAGAQDSEWSLALSIASSQTEA
jgi:hypothetical protein